MSVLPLKTVVSRLKLRDFDNVLFTERVWTCSRFVLIDKK